MRNKRTDRLPSAVHRPGHLRSEVFHEMAERVEKQERAAIHAFAHLRATAVIDRPERQPIRWVIAGLTLVVLVGAGWFYWDWIAGLFG